MNLLEIFEKPPGGYHSEKEDNTSSKPREPRKTRLTLAQINKLRVMNDVRSYEKEKKIEAVKKQYLIPASSGMPGM